MHLELARVEPAIDRESMPLGDVHVRGIVRTLAGKPSKIFFMSTLLSSVCVSSMTASAASIARIISVVCLARCSSCAR